MYKRIVVGVARVETAQKAARDAIDLATKLGAELHLVMAFAGAGGPVRPDRQHAEGFLESIALSSSLPIRTHALPGDPAAAIPARRGRGRCRPHRRRQQGHARREPDSRQCPEQHRPQDQLLDPDRQHDLSDSRRPSRVDVQLDSVRDRRDDVPMRSSNSPGSTVQSSRSTSQNANARRSSSKSPRR